MLAGIVEIGVGAVVIRWFRYRRSVRRLFAVAIARELAVWEGLDRLLQSVAEVQKFEGEKTLGWVRKVEAEVETAQYFIEAVCAPITKAETAVSRGRLVRAAHALRQALDLVDRADSAWMGAEMNWSVLDKALREAHEGKIAADTAQAATHAHLAAEQERTGWLLPALAAQVLTIDEQYTEGISAHEVDPVGAISLLQAVVGGYEAVTRSLADVAPTQALLMMQQGERQRIATFVQEQEWLRMGALEGSLLEALERSLCGEEQTHLDLAYGAVALAHEALTVAVHSVRLATAVLHRDADAPLADETAFGEPNGMAEAG